jgi:chaperone required for assembly of F1-ATPase
MKPPNSGTQKRFYKAASVAEREDGTFAVLLDGRQVKTPAGKQLCLPTPGLAEAVAGEWNAQGETIVPASLPLTKLANTAIDAVAARKADVAGDIVKYAGADLVCYRAEYPAGLVAAQAAVWDPVLSWAETRYGVRFLTSAGIAHIEQPQASLEAIAEAAGAFDAFKLTALHVMTTLMGSALIALAHAEGALGTAGAWAAAHTDEDWQIAHWGEDYEACQRRKARLAEFEAAARFFHLS